MPVEVVARPFWKEGKSKEEGLASESEMGRGSCLTVPVPAGNLSSTSRNNS
jgi:hypothetical protein